jgi:hypothetical protein
MGVDIISRKFWNQLRNGINFTSNPSDYTDFLLGTICEKIKTETTIDVWWKSEGTEYVDLWDVVIAAGTCTITRDLYSFVDDGFAVGDTIYWEHPTYGNGTGVVSQVNALTIVLTSFTGGLITGAGYYAIALCGTTSLTAGIFKFNLIENSEADTFISKVDGSTISYAGNGFTGTDTTLVWQGTFLSGNDSGTAKIKTGSSGSSWKQRFIITHEFWVTPFYLSAQYNNLQNGIAPSYLLDLKSLKYIANYELRATLYNPNIVHGGTDSIKLGDVSWFDEHFNGFIPIEFNKQSLIYTVGGNPATELNIAWTTHVICEVNSVNNVFSSGNTKFLVNLFMLPVDDDEYRNTATTMQQNYVFDQAFQTIAGAAAAGINAIITNVVGSIVTNRLHVEFDVAFTNPQKTLIDSHEYIISIITDDHTTNHATSKRANVLMAYTGFSTAGDNALLQGRSNVKFWEHPFDPTIPLTGTKNYRGWITDGVYLQSGWINLPALGTLDMVRIKVRAINSVTDDNFELFNYNMDLAGMPVIANERIVNISTTRGFKLVAGSLRNLVSLENGAVPGTGMYYLKFGFKLGFEDWITMLNANNVFFDNAELNGALNEKWSSYFDKVLNWDLEIIVQTLVTDLLTGLQTTFNIISGLDCHNYFEDGNAIPLWTGHVETFITGGTVSMGTDSSAAYSSTEDTLVVAIFTSVNALLTSDLYGIIYLGGFNIDGRFTQWQISTEELPAPNNWLKPITGQTKAKLTVIDANHVKVEAMIDFTKAAGDVTFVARIGYSCQDIAEVLATDAIIINTWSLPSLIDFVALFNLTRFYDMTINGTPWTGNMVNPPYGYAEVVAEILAGYSYTLWAGFTSIFVSGCSMTALAGTGSSENGTTIELKIYTATHALLYTFNWTLAGGVDEFICPGSLTPTNRLLQETGNYILQENGDFINLET